MSNEESARQTSALAVSPKNELTLSSPELIVGAKLIRHRPEVLLARIEQYLPNPVEARLYLAIGPKLKHRPRTFSRILRELLGTTEINAQDLESRRNESVAKVDKLLYDLETALTLILRMPYDYNDLRLGAETVARMVIAYGDDTDAFLASVMDNIPEVGEILGYKPRHLFTGKRGEDWSCVWYPENAIAKHAFGFWGHVIYPECVKYGIPYVIEFLDYFKHDEFLEAALENQLDVEKFIDDEKVRPAELNFVGGGFLN